MNDSQKEATAYIQGYIAACKDLQVPERELAVRLGTILYKAWEGRGQCMPVVRKNSKRDMPERKAVAALENNGSAHSGASVQPRKSKGVGSVMKNGKIMTRKLLKSMRENAAIARAKRAAKLAAEAKLKGAA